MTRLSFPLIPFTAVQAQGLTWFIGSSPAGGKHAEEGVAGVPIGDNLRSRRPLADASPAWDVVAASSRLLIRPLAKVPLAVPLPGRDLVGFARSTRLDMVP